MALMIILSFFLLTAFSVTTVSQGPSTQVFSWYDSNNSYHFLAFAWNGYGQPLDGVTFDINLTVFQTNVVSCPSTTSYYATATTGDSGVANLSISAPVNPAYSVCIMASAEGTSFSQPMYLPYVNSNSVEQNSTSPAPIPPGQIVAQDDDPVQTVSASGSSGNAVLLNWAGAYGAPPTNYSIYYDFYNASQPGLNFNPNWSESNMTYLGNMTGYLEMLKLPPIPSNIDSNSSFIALGVFSPNGTAVGYIQSLYTQSYYAPPASQVSVSQGNTIVLGFFQGIFGLFIPLLAILGSYNSYGKDRASGVLESVLAQPISRRGLSISRFVSSFSAMAIATAVAMGVVDGIFHYYTGQFFNATLLLISAGAFFVELASFIALMMLFSRILKSSGLLVGVGIFLFLLFSLFWSILLDLVEVAINPRSVGSFQNLVIAEYLNPAQFIALVDTYVSHNLSSGGIGGVGGLLITPSAYGITIYSLVATAVLWIGLPLAGFLYLAIKKD